MADRGKQFYIICTKAEVELQYSIIAESVEEAKEIYDRDKDDIVDGHVWMQINSQEIVSIEGTYDKSEGTWTP